MDNYFVEQLNWAICTQPINAIDFSASLKELEALADVLEMVGMPFSENVWEIFNNNIKDEYYTLDVKVQYVDLLTCDDRIAPVPTQYINTVVPALILAHLNDPLSVMHVYNEFFINKKEEITPLLEK